MASAAFSIGGGASLAMYEATSAEVVTIALDSVDGVRVSNVRVVSTDETTVAGDWVIASATATSTTVTCPAQEGVACLLQWTVNAGTITDPTTGQTTIGDLVKTAKISIPTAGGFHVICSGETTEHDATYGWAAPINDVIRNGGGGGGSGDIEGVTAGAGMTGGGTTGTVTLNVIANADGTIVVNANDIQVGTLIAGNVPNDLITYAKIQDAPSAGFIGATAAGDYEHRTVAQAQTAIVTTTSVLAAVAGQTVDVGILVAATSVDTTTVNIGGAGAGITDDINDGLQIDGNQVVITSGILHDADGNLLAPIRRSLTINWEDPQSYEDLDGGGTVIPQTASTASLYEVTLQADHPTLDAVEDLPTSHAQRVIHVIARRNASNVCAFHYASGETAAPWNIADVEFQFVDSTGDWKVQARKDTADSYVGTAEARASIRLLGTVPWTTDTTPTLTLFAPTMTESQWLAIAAALTASLDVNDQTITDCAGVTRASGNVAVTATSGDVAVTASGTVGVTGGTGVEVAATTGDVEVCAVDASGLIVVRTGSTSAGRAVTIGQTAGDRARWLFYSGPTDTLVGTLDVTAAAFTFTGVSGKNVTWTATNATLALNGNTVNIIAGAAGMSLISGATTLNLRAVGFVAIQDSSAISRIKFQAATNVATASTSRAVLATIAIPTGAMVRIRATVKGWPAAAAGQRTAVDGFYENVGGTVSMIGTTTFTDGGAALGTVDVTISGTNVTIGVTPVDGTAYTWHANDLGDV